MLPALLALTLLANAPAETATSTAIPASTSTSTPTATAGVWGQQAQSSPFPAGVAIPALLLAALAAAAFLVTRKRAQRGKLVEVLESTSLGPRRSLVVARLGEEILVLGSSEAGITLLTTSPAPLAARAPVRAPAPEDAPAGGRGLGLLARLRLRPQRAPAPVFDSLLSESMEDLELRRKLAVGQGGSVR